MRRITPVAGWQRLHLGIAIFFGSIAVACFAIAFSPEGPSSQAVSGALVGGLASLAIKSYKRGIYLKGNLVFVRMVWSTHRFQLSQIESFTWLINTQSVNGAARRLWIVLTDGQKIATPIGISPAIGPPGEVMMTQLEADALISSLEAQRQAAADTLA